MEVMRTRLGQVRTGLAISWWALRPLRSNQSCLMRSGRSPALRPYRDRRRVNGDPPCLFDPTARVDVVQPLSRTEAWTLTIWTR